MGIQYELIQFKSPIGKIGVLQSSRGVRRILFENEMPFYATVKALYPNDSILKTEKDHLGSKQELLEFLNGKRQIFSIPVDLIAPPFYKKALKEVAKIPYGGKASYKDIAERCNNPNACRAVGSANANNPIPLMIPCHRVLTHKGALGGFAGGIKIKRFLLDLESQ